MSEGLSDSDEGFCLMAPRRTRFSVYDYRQMKFPVFITTFILVAYLFHAVDTYTLVMAM